MNPWKTFVIQSGILLASSWLTNRYVLEIEIVGNHLGIQQFIGVAIPIMAAGIGLMLDRSLRKEPVLLGLGTYEYGCIRKFWVKITRGELNDHRSRYPDVEP